MGATNEFLARIPRRADGKRNWPIELKARIVAETLILITSHYQNSLPTRTRLRLIKNKYKALGYTASFTSKVNSSIREQLKHALTSALSTGLLKL